MNKPQSTLVIGAGILGLAVGRELLLRNPGARVTILEKESEIACHQTSHNSGVIHSGIYYPQDSLKASLCREGIPLLHQFCDDHGIERRVCGKVIVATRAEELSSLEWVYERGKANKIPGLRKISRKELREREPAVAGLKALFLPKVALINFRVVAEAIAKDFKERGGKITLHARIKSIHASKSGWGVETERKTHKVNALINCAGLQADEVAEMAGCNLPIRIVPFRGEYFRLKPEWAKKIHGLVYPAPDPRFPFLGVHLTPTLTGEMRVGPNAVLALSREGYRWTHLNARDVLKLFRYPGFWRMSLRNWKMGLAEAARAMMKPLYTAQVNKLLPGVRSSDLMPDGSGVRAQAVGRDGSLMDDFLYVHEPHAVHLLNAPSPAATTSFALAKHIVNLL